MGLSSFHLLRQAAVAVTCATAMFVGVAVVGLTPGTDNVAVVYAQEPPPTPIPPPPSSTPEEPSLVLLATGGLGMLTYGLMRLRARK